MKMKPATYVILLLALISCSSSPGGRGLSETGFFSSPDEIIQKLSGPDRSPDEHFMLGIALKKKKQYKEAIRHFADSCFRFQKSDSLRIYPQPVYKFVNGLHFKSRFFNDSVYEIANLFFLYREYEHVVKFIDLASSEKTALYRDSVILKARALAFMKKYDEAAVLLEDAAGYFEDGGSKSIIDITLGSVLEKSGNSGGAVKRYLSAISREPKSWQAHTAADRLLDIMKDHSADLTDGQRLSLAKALYNGKKYPEATFFLSAIRGIDKKYGDAVELMLKCLVRKNDQAGISSIIRNASFSDRTDLLNKIQADELWSAGKKQQAVQIYSRLAGLEKDYSRVCSERVASYMEDKKLQGYETRLSEYVEKYKKDPASENFLWLLGRSRLKSGDIGGAEKYFEAAVKIFPSGASSDHCRFWLYKIYSAKNQKEKSVITARDMSVKNPDSSLTWILLKRISSGQSIEHLEKKFSDSISNDRHDDAVYYHTLLFIRERDIKKRSNRLSKLKSDEMTSYSFLEKTISGLDVPFGLSGRLKCLEKYFSIGYLHGINREAKTFSKKDPEESKSLNIALAHYGRKYGNPFLSVNSTLEIMKSEGIRESAAMMPEETVKCLLPRPFEDCVKRQSVEYGISEDMIYSIIKAESLFNHRAVSSAGAVGLMQLMPATAKGIAREIKIAGYNLKDPCVSIQFGAHYLAWLWKFFKGEFGSIVAGYNAGAGNVNKWKKAIPKEDGDYFAEFVPFSETKYYIIRTEKFLIQYSITAGRQK
jgi:tetratricopeptide (TPR) repeat protein